MWLSIMLHLNQKTDVAIGKYLSFFICMNVFTYEEQSKKRGH